MRAPNAAPGDPFAAATRLTLISAGRLPDTPTAYRAAVTVTMVLDT